MGDHTLAVHRDHVRARLGAQTPQVHFGRALHAHHVVLAAFRERARLIPVIEEGVEAGAVDENLRGREDAKAPGFLTRIGGAAAEGWIKEGRVRGEGREGVRVGLHVSGRG